MSSAIPTTGSTRTFSGAVDTLRGFLEKAEAVVIGAGAGLSASAGYTYTGERFDKYFADFAGKYGLHDMYSGGFYPYPTQEEFWAYWSRYILINRYTAPPKPVYDRLLDLVSGRDYFVLTTNVDHCFQRAGFDRRRLFYTQGDYGLFQCSGPCRQETWDNEDLIRRMVSLQADMRVPSALLPVCPHCGRPLVPNLRSDDTFVEDPGWHAACDRFEAFLASHRRGRVLYLELGVGYNTPGIIKYPFWRMTARNQDAMYACVNLGSAYAPEDILPRSVCIDADIGSVIAALGGHEAEPIQ